MLPTPLHPPATLRTPRRLRTRARLGAATALALTALLATSAPAVAAPASATDAADDVPVTGEACSGSGITVVVDFPGSEDGTDPGRVVVGCAEGDDEMTGTEALRAAGFTDTRDDATMVCAVDGFPDPCPTEFTGDWWSYWFADVEGDAGWETYQEGSDTVTTQAGRVEGWRYSDGADGPRVDPAAISEALAPDAGGEPTEDVSATEAETGAAQDDATDEAATDEAAPAAADAATDRDADADGVPAWVWFAGGLVVLALAVLAFNAVRPGPDGPRGQD